MTTSAPKSSDQWLVGLVLILLMLLTLYGLYLDLSRRPPGKSRVDWPPPTSIQP